MVPPNLHRSTQGGHVLRNGCILIVTGLACIAIERSLGRYLDDDLAATMLLLVCAVLGIGLSRPFFGR